MNNGLNMVSITCRILICRYVHWRPNGYHQVFISVFVRGRLMILLPPPAFN